MALAFFTTPTLPSLTSFGFSKTTQESTPPTSDPSPDSDPRPVSASVGAIIKCSDCGGDVPLAELTEHVCSLAKSTSSSASTSKPRTDPKSTEPPDKPRSRFGSQNDLASNTTPYAVIPRDHAAKTSRYLEPQNVTTPKPSKTSAYSANQPAAPSSFASSARDKLNRARSNSNLSNGASPPFKATKMLAQTSKDSSSDFSLSNSDSSFSTQSSTSKMPFFERYAQLVPKPSALSSSKKQSDPLDSPSDDWTSPVSDNFTAWPAKKSKQTAGASARMLKVEKVVTPITSPEPSPSEDAKYEDWYHPRPNNSRNKLPASSSMPFVNQARTGLATERRAAASRPQKDQSHIVGSRSAASGLDQLLASEDYDTFGDDEFTSGEWRAEAEKPFAKVPQSTRSPAGYKAQEPAASGLEDLMGDLMAEMEKKAEISSERLKTKARTPARPDFKLPESSGSRPKLERSAGETRLNKTNYNDPNRTPRVQGRLPAAGLEPPVPESPDIKPSDSISQWGFTRSPSPTFFKPLQLASTASDDLCQRCGDAPIRRQKNSTTDESRFCRGCYADLYLPKCRKCSEPIEGGAVTDRVGKVLGKYHARCFNCFQCSAPFPTGDFYVWERKPVCSKHYHRLAGTICCNESCGSGIEGPCVTLILEGSSVGSVTSDGSSEPGSISNSARRRLYHPEHFTCARRGCFTSLHEFHFVVKGQPWCEEHALQEEDPGRWRSNPSERAPPVSSHTRDGSAPRDRMRPGRGPIGLPHPSKRMERRRTVIQNVHSK